MENLSGTAEDEIENDTDRLAWVLLVSVVGLGALQCNLHRDPGGGPAGGNTDTSADVQPVDGDTDAARDVQSIDGAADGASDGGTDVQPVDGAADGVTDGGRDGSDDVRPNDSGTDATGDTSPPEDADDAVDDACESATDDCESCGNTCSDCETCSNGTCSFRCSACAKCEHRLFATSRLYDADLGGLSGADTKCNQLANDAGLGGTWRAVLSSPTDHAGSRITVNGPVYNLDGVKLTNDLQGLVSGSLFAPVQFDENRTSISSAPQVWSGSTERLLSDGYHCEDWTRSSTYMQGANFGDATASDASWFDDDSASHLPCGGTGRLYCIDGQ